MQHTSSRVVSRFVGLIVSLAVAGCDGGGTSGGGDGGALDAARPDAAQDDGGSASVDGGGVDASAPDAGTPLDGGGSPTDGGEPDACLPPPCVPPPEGCMYVGSDPCSCGTLVCPGECDGELCEPNEHCAYDTAYACGGSGSCQPRPELCPRILMPVCGCDGATYDNACEANRAGTDVAAEGECGATAEDCRTTGCTGGSTCQECRAVDRTVWVCIPAGAVC